MNSNTSQKWLEDALAQDRRTVEDRCARLLDSRGGKASRVNEAMRYMLLGGGKRLRPLLTLWTHDAVGGKARQDCLDVACAIESLHTYSLVHDDLPCMDDDDMRRGRPSCHKEFGEAVAVLTGDALLTLCFDILCSLGHPGSVSDQTTIDVMRIVVKAAGTEGLITGQAMDLMAGELEADVKTVHEIHRYKTAALIAASMEAGAVMGGVDGERRERVRRAGRLAGHAFQIIDDLLDLDTSAETLGKTTGKHAKLGKLTYPSVAGIGTSRQRAETLIREAKVEMDVGGERTRLGALLDRMVDRRQ
jgi:geranylgeranyl diphosphate synthase type II